MVRLSRGLKQVLVEGGFAETPYWFGWGNLRMTKNTR